MTLAFPSPRRTALAALLAAGSVLVAGCAPLVIGGAAAATGMVATDRRSAGTQVEDQTIEVKADSAATSLLGDKAHVVVTSYNRVALITGEVPTEADKAAVDKAIAAVQNVRSTVNDLAVMPNSSLTTRSNDSIITGQVKAGFLDAKDLSVNSIKVVTERGVVFLLGLVTEAEAQRAVGIARSVGGVQKVVRVFEIITPAQAAALQPAPPASAPAPKT